jgi:hypothetical protein
MDTTRAALIFEAGQSAGADFVEIFEEESRASHLTLKDRVIENAGPVPNTALACVCFLAPRLCTATPATTPPMPWCVW